ncbi:thiamine-phosphate kinase [Termitidicoccus mucosus]|uniref:Thiamine-monophosphate kinase n=1 Tax=Termitidicoccus mucosus TaxID=1184151 RepID=A0A178ILH1_9BACT|nr:thiamine-monophosphate kinase [Opitutaceae bacterium TSB47]
MSPFDKNNFSETVAALGEERLIVAIRRWLGDATPPAPAGIGDDCAVIPASPRAQVVTVDPVIHGRHFDDSVPARAVGAKLLKRNLSDLASMGAMPRAAVVALTLPPRTRIRWLEHFYRGLAACARAHKLHIVGGDVAQDDHTLAASLTLIGQPAGGRLLTRGGARAGDWIYVTGTLGGSLSGKHWRFTPRLAEGAWLAAQPEVRCMTDISDGIAKDLRPLAPSGARPALDANTVPVSRAARRAAACDGRTPLDHALADGEDYELAFAIAQRADRDVFARRWKKRFPRLPLTCIGRFVPNQKSLPSGAIDLTRHHGYEHLRATKSET